MCSAVTTLEEKLHNTKSCIFVIIETSKDLQNVQQMITKENSLSPIKFQLYISFGTNYCEFRSADYHTKIAPCHHQFIKILSKTIIIPSGVATAANSLQEGSSLDPYARGSQLLGSPKRWFKSDCTPSVLAFAEHGMHRNSNKIDNDKYIHASSYP